MGGIVKCSYLIAGCWASKVRVVIAFMENKNWDGKTIKVMIKKTCIMIEVILNVIFESKHRKYFKIFSFINKNLRFSHDI